MEELIKIAENGQWLLEKAKSPEEVQQMVAEFLARKKSTGAVSPTVPKPPAVGLKPAQRSEGANPMYSKEQVARIRAGLPPEANSQPTQSATSSPTAVDPQKKHMNQVTQREERKQGKADDKAKASQGNKAAWEAGVAFLAQHGDKGYKMLHAQMQQRKALDAAHSGKPLSAPVKPQLLPPQEPFTDEKGNRTMRDRQGTFHNQGATTTGKIVKRGFKYQDKETNEDRFGSSHQQEKHHWAWDHNNKKWNHIKTTLVSPNIG